MLTPSETSESRQRERWDTVSDDALDTRWNWRCFTFTHAEIRGIKLGPLSLFIWRRHLCACVMNRWAIPSVQRQLSWEPDAR
jgi:hypothetical protein